MFKLRPVLVTVLLVSACGGDSGGPSEPPPSASLSGIVREDGAGTAIAGATVTVGSASLTTGQDGRFQFPSVPVGSVATVRVTAVGFDEYAQTIDIRQGANTHDISLTRRTIYGRGAIAALLLPKISTYRGVLFLIPGGSPGQGGDSRPFLRGEPRCWAYAGDGCPTDAEFRIELLKLAEKFGLALFGNEAMANTTSSYDEMLATIAYVAQQSGHAELANAPLLLVGSSAGGCMAHGFARVHTARVIGFVSAKGGCHVGGVSPASTVPAYLFIGEEDPVSPTAIFTITELFLENRAAGAPWALAIELGAGHWFPRDNRLHINWFDAVLTRRLPPVTMPGTPAALRPIDEVSGWLGNRTSFTIAGYACYTSTKQQASWLPSEQSARDWQNMASAGSVTAVASCP